MHAGPIECEMYATGEIQNVTPRSTSVIPSADGVRFELTTRFRVTVFKTVALDHSATHPEPLLYHANGFSAHEE